jgi:hypothetical protein
MEHVKYLDVTFDKRYMDEWMNGRMDGYTDRQTERFPIQK